MINKYKQVVKREKSSINTTKFLREGQSIEELMRINTANKEMPTQMLPEIYQERSEGIDPLCDIRTDKFEQAQAAMDKVTRAHLLASQNKENFGKGDNTWITDDEGNPIYDAPTYQAEE